MGVVDGMSAPSEKPDEPEDPETAEALRQLSEPHLGEPGFIAVEDRAGWPVLDVELGRIEDVAYTEYPDPEIIVAPDESDDLPDGDGAEPTGPGDHVAEAETEFVVDTIKAFVLEGLKAIADAHGLRLLVMACDYGGRMLSALDALDSTSGIDFDVPLPLGPVDLPVSMRVEGDPDDTSWPIHWFLQPADGLLIGAIDIGPADRGFQPSDGWPKLAAGRGETPSSAGAVGERLEPVINGETATYTLDLRFVADRQPSPEMANELRRFARGLWNKGVSGDRAASKIELIVLRDTDSGVSVFVPVRAFT